MNAETEITGRKSIIGSKYSGKYKEKDWLGQFVDANATDAVTKEKKIKAEDGTETTETFETGKRVLVLDKLFALAEANHLDIEHLKEQADRPNAPGRLRMTIGNMLRAAAKHRHGLFSNEGEWTDADADFLGEAVKTHNPDGSKIVVAKAEDE